LTDLTAWLDNKVTPEDVNRAFEKAAQGSLKGILAVSREELVSSDFRGNPHSSIVDAPFTKVVDGDAVKVLSWYDNEWGFSCRVIDLLHRMGERGL
jgi:glyceraldehyde 3-phosphate dehydrogenase